MPSRIDRAPTLSAPAVADPRPKFPKDEAGFMTELRRRADAYFAETGRSERDCWRMYLKTAVILAWLATSYALLVFAAPTVWLAAPLSISLAFAISAVGFSIQHDGGHHAYSRFAWVNRLAALSLDLIGASSYLWRWKHVVYHHTYPNVDGQDTDIDVGFVARLAPQQRRRWFHRWQHLYLWPLYGLTASVWHLYGDFRDVITGQIGAHRIPRPKGWDLVVFLVGKLVSIGLLLGVPMCVHSWWVVFTFYMVVTAVVGVVLTVVFQLAHCVGEAEFPEPIDGGRRMEGAWAVHQVRTTVDFARQSRVLCWLLGGLNFQVVHHLFPRVCHIHYPALSRIVEATCRDFGVRYSAHQTFLAGIVSHFRWLRDLGRPQAIPT
ncbi:fatty acid desaturase family protein [Frigoriglobus tundricola]|uniref:Linoleoyl-CoA desaturase n=1 Tax=Frigoriglobus tundricola TaxID=2774151 RepID=A0A6M5YQ78_9BACT|nr:acyl-CoA desaturase [Frigoriglobus tundricola]QJW95453.1 Linoleoyl-CoA desaturase [Frigoriglobus tundricola]